MLDRSVIAIDGPGASGKSAVGRTLAERLGYRFLDTGLMYRAVTWLALRAGIAVDDEERIARLAEETDVHVDKEGVLRLGNGPVLRDELREPEVERNVSLVARLPAVRRVLVAKQRALAEARRMVMVGRDIGTTVLPDAGLKVFLTASPRVRAERRHKDLVAQHAPIALDDVLSDLERRDAIDSQRPVSPLRAAPDATVVDTDSLSLNEVVAHILAMIEPHS